MGRRRRGEGGRGEIECHDAHSKGDGGSRRPQQRGGGEGGHSERGGGGVGARRRGGPPRPRMTTQDHQTTLFAHPRARARRGGALHDLVTATCHALRDSPPSRRKEAASVSRPPSLAPRSLSAEGPRGHRPRTKGPRPHPPSRASLAHHVALFAGISGQTTVGHRTWFTGRIELCCVLALCIRS